MQARDKKAYEEIEANDRFWRSDADILRILRQGGAVVTLSSRMNGYV